MMPDQIAILLVIVGHDSEPAELSPVSVLFREMNKHLRDERDMSFQVRIIYSGVEDEEELTSTALRQTLVNGLYQPSISAEASGRFQRIISIEEDHLPYLLIESQTENAVQEYAEGERGSGSEDGVDMMSAVYGRSSPHQLQPSEESVEERQIPSSPRGQPVGKETSINVSVATCKV
ncbi:hypothetical protein XENOCAPTIV_029911 [Xenoophorus captivus]|uniref:Uncharacterized protein n=1 Tax=Xenoophorus captivus TaxID=1517983 RepID=A0ABV0QF85_9TELE